MIGKKQNWRRISWVPLGLAIINLLSTASAADWYRWRGPDLNGISTETGWQSKWADEGPKQLWKASIGTGFSSVTVSKGRVYALGNQNDVDTIFCFDAKTGVPVWKYSYSAPLDPKFYEGGPSSTPTIDDDRVYTLSKNGDLVCVDSLKGKLIWSTNVTKSLGLVIPTWGFAGSVLVEGNLAILNVGSVGTAFDKMTGKVVWRSGAGAPGYATPLAFTSGNERLLAIFGAQSLDVVKLADGHKVWSFPWKTEYDVNAAAPILSGDEAFVSSGYGHGAALVKFAGNQPTQVWQNKNMKNQFSSSVLWQGFIYGVDESQLTCLDWKTGAVKWTNPKFGKGSLMLADGKLVGLSERGELIIAEAAPEQFKVISRAQVLGGKCWTVPVLSNGHIYCRNAKGDLVCLDVSGT